MNEAQSQYIAAVVDVLKQHAAAAGLSERVMQRIAVEALAGGHLQDPHWLEDRLQAVDFDDESATADDDDDQGLAGGNQHLLGNLGEDDEPSLVAKEGEGAKPAGHLPTIAISPPLTITCQAELDEAVVRHRDWMESVLDPQMNINPGRANFRGADLSGLSLQGVNLSCADFTGANLTGTALCYANLSRCKFNQAVMERADLRGAKLKKAQFQDADLRQANLQETDLRETDLSSAKLDDAKLPSEFGLM